MPDECTELTCPHHGAANRAKTACPWQRPNGEKCALTIGHESRCYFPSEH